MIQRIQSLFLLAATALQIVFLLSPLSTFLMEGNATIMLYCNGFRDNGTDGGTILSNIPLLILGISILALIFFDIFLYKKRILQIRICIYTILLNAGLIAFLVLVISGFLKHNQVSAHSYSIAIAIPLVNIILLFLAFRGIRKDEVLIKAYERLR
jgi:hypothetical protein